MYRVVKPFATANRRFLVGAELEAADLPEHLDADRLLLSGHIERTAPDSEAPPPADPPANPPPVELAHDDAAP